MAKDESTVKGKPEQKVDFGSLSSDKAGKATPTTAFPPGAKDAKELGKLAGGLVSSHEHGNNLLPARPQKSSPGSHDL